MNNIEQWKDRTLIGTLSLIMVLVNGGQTYRHYQQEQAAQRIRTTQFIQAVAPGPQTPPQPAPVENQSFVLTEARPAQEMVFVGGPMQARPMKAPQQTPMPMSQNTLVTQHLETVVKTESPAISSEYSISTTNLDRDARQAIDRDQREHAAKTESQTIAQDNVSPHIDASNPQKIAAVVPTAQTAEGSSAEPKSHPVGHFFHAIFTSLQKTFPPLQYIHGSQHQPVSGYYYGNENSSRNYGQANTGNSYQAAHTSNSPPLQVHTSSHQPQPVYTSSAKLPPAKKK